MVQLILDVDGEKITLPESQKGGYTVTKEPLSSSVQMISGRTVKEVRGNIWVINYQYGYFSQEELPKLLRVCDKGVLNTIACSFLVQENERELETAEFHVASYTRPKFMWSTNSEGEAVPLWGDFSIELRAVYPVD